MIAAGLGCRRDTAASDILDVIQQATDAAGVDTAAIACLSIPDFKQSESGVHQAASELSIPVVVIPRSVIERFQEETITKSEKVLAAIGLANVAEAAALAGAGPGASLLAPRAATPFATCALATRKLAITEEPVGADGW